MPCASRPLTQRMLRMPTATAPGEASGMEGMSGASSGAQRSTQDVGQTVGEQSWRSAAAAEQAALVAERLAAQQGASSSGAVDAAMLRSHDSRRAQHGMPEQAFGGTAEESSGAGSSERSERLFGQWREHNATLGEGCGLPSCPKSAAATTVRITAPLLLHNASTPAWKSAYNSAAITEEALLMAG